MPHPYMSTTYTQVQQRTPQITTKHMRITHDNAHTRKQHAHTHTHTRTQHIHTHTYTGVARVMGVLAIARAIGDAPLKPFVSSIPDTKLMPRDQEQWYVPIPLYSCICMCVCVCVCVYV